MSNNSSCPVLWPWPQSVPCSGHGECVDSKCVCDVGYTGIGDFAPLVGEDCDIDVMAIRVLWGISFLPSLVNAGFSLRYFWLKRRVMAASSNPKQQSWLHTINLVPTGTLLFSVFLIVLAGMKVYNPELAAIGSSLSATVIFGCAYKVFWTTQSLFSYVFLKLTAKQAKIFSKKLLGPLSIMQRSLSLLFVIDFIWAFCPLILLSFPSSVNIIGAIHYIGAALNIVFIGFVVFPRTIRAVRDDIRKALNARGLSDSSSSHERRIAPGDLDTNPEIMALREAEKKLSGIYNFILNNGIQQLAIACIIGLWPFMLRKASYQIPIAYSLGQIASAYEIHSISNFSKPSENSHTVNKLESSRSGGKGAQVHMEQANSLVAPKEVTQTM